MRFLAVALLALSITVAHADPKAPSYHLTTVSWVVAKKDKLQDGDRYVKLIGRVVKKGDDNEIWFNDGTGSVRLDVGKFDLPVGTSLVIAGCIDEPFLGIGHLEVDVKQWRYVRNP